MDPMTEERAIRALQRLAARWPKTLGLVQHTDSGFLKVVHVGDGRLFADDPANLPAIASVRLMVAVCA